MVKFLVGSNISLIDNEEIKPIKEEYDDGEIKVKDIEWYSSSRGVKDTHQKKQAGIFIVMEDLWWLQIKLR